jgi:hypothetical protein
MYEGQVSSPQLRAVQDTAQGGAPPLLQRNVAAAYTSLLTPHHSGELVSLPSSPPTTPPRSCHKARPGPWSPTKNLLRVQGEAEAHRLSCTLNSCSPRWRAPIQMR